VNGARGHESRRSHRDGMLKRQIERPSGVVERTISDARSNLLEYGVGTTAPLIYQQAPTS